MPEALFLIYVAPLEGEHVYIFLLIVIHLVISRLDTELDAKKSTENIKNVLTFIELTFWRAIQRVYVYNVQMKRSILRKKEE